MVGFRCVDQHLARGGETNVLTTSKDLMNNHLTTSKGVSCVKKGRHPVFMCAKVSLFLSTPHLDL